MESYFIQNSVLTLYTHKPCTDAGVLDSQQVLVRDSSFVYNQDAWRGSITGGAFLGGLDVSTTVEKFLTALPNPNAKYSTPAANQQQILIVSNMQAYMDAYDAWAGPPSNFGDSSLKSKAISVHGSLLSSVQGLYSCQGNATNCPPAITCTPP